MGTCARVDPTLPSSATGMPAHSLFTGVPVRAFLEGPALSSSLSTSSWFRDLFLLFSFVSVGMRPAFVASATISDQLFRAPSRCAAFGIAGSVVGIVSSRNMLSVGMIPAFVASATTSDQRFRAPSRCAASGIAGSAIGIVASPRMPLKVFLGGADVLESSSSVLLRLMWDRNDANESGMRLSGTAPRGIPTEGAGR